jgi:hypothetical protein
LFKDDKAKALHYYQHNLQLCAALYELLSDTEILLRNRIHASCSHYFGTTDWSDCCDIPEITDTVAMIRQRILKRDGLPSTDKIIAELNLGFWTSLFNKQYAQEPCGSRCDIVSPYYLLVLQNASLFPINLTSSANSGTVFFITNPLPSTWLNWESTTRIYWTYYPGIRSMRLCGWKKPWPSGRCI